MTDISREIPVPVLFNTWKHHAGYLRHRVESAVGAGDAALDDLAEQMAVVGSNLMDLYTGRYTPAEIADRVLNQLREAGRLDFAAFGSWVDASGGYGVLTLDDASQWVMRRGVEAGRYVHLHPGRWVPQTKRVRANVVKTAVMVLAYCGVHGGEPMDRDLVNLVRRDFLDLAPVGRDPSGEAGLGEMLALLRGTTS
jgi:hypothetical protein